MSVGIDTSAAPPFVGPNPPDQQEMTFGEHLQAALQVFASRPLDAMEMRDFKAFIVGIEAEVQKKMAGQQGAPGATPGQAGPTGNETGDYGGAGQPPQEGLAPYGSV